MTRLALLLASLYVLFSVVGCGGDDDPADRGGRSTTEQATPPNASEGPSDEPEAERQPKPGNESTGAAKFMGQHRQNYKDSKFVCAAFPPAQLAREEGLEGNRGRSAEELGEIAEAHSKGYRPQYQQAAFEGCLAGLPDAAE